MIGERVRIMGQPVHTHRYLKFNYVGGIYVLVYCVSLASQPEVGVCGVEPTNHQVLPPTIQPLNQRETKHQCPA